jgi:hypothetical protein
LQKQIYDNSIDNISSSAIKHCVSKSARNSFTVIDGGAGTRKSEILKTLVNVLSLIFPNYQIDVEVPNEEVCDLLRQLVAFFVFCILRIVSNFVFTL